MALKKIGSSIVLEGEKEYRQAISDINKSMTVLKSELKLSSAEFEGQANSMDALKSKGKILSDLYEEQEKKARTMAGALEEVTKTYGENSAQTKEWQAKLNNAQAELTKLDTKLKDNSKLLDEAKKSTNGCATSIDGYGKKVKNATNDTLTFGDVLKANLTSDVIIAGVKALGQAMKQVGDAAIDTVRDTAAYADNILTMANNTGIATDTLQELQYMQELTDVSLDQVTSSMAKQIKAMSNAQKGTADYVDAYAKLGVAVKDSNGVLRDSETVYWESIDALKQISNETERDATAMVLFGKSAQDLNSLIKLGSEGVKEFAQEARDMGAVLDEETLGKLGATDDAFQRIDQSLQIFKRELGISMGPSITKSIDKVVDKFTEMDDEISEVAGGVLEMLADGLVWIMDNADVIISALSGIAGGFAAFKTISGIQFAIDKLKLLSTTAGGTMGVLKSLFTLVSGNPVALAATGIGIFTAAIALIATKSDKSKSDLEKLHDEIDKTVESSKKLREETKDLFASQDTRMDDSVADVEKYQVLADKLYDLADAETITNDQKREMQMLVNELNSAFPELGLSLDSLTGKLNKQRIEIDSLLESYIAEAKVAAARKDIVEIAEAEYDAKKKITEQELLLVDAKEELAKAEDEYNRRLKEGQFRDLATAQRMYISLTEDATDSVDDLKSEMDAQNKILTECSDRYNTASGYVKEFDTSLQDAGQSANGASEQIDTMVIEVKESLDELSKKYTEVKTSAEESLMQQIGLFDEFSSETKLSKEEILANLQSQIDGMKNWSENMDKATELGVSDKILKEFRDMGIDSESYLNEIIRMNESEIEDLNSKWETKLSIADQISTEMAQAEINLNESLRRMELAIATSSLMRLPSYLQEIDQKQSNQQPIKNSGVISNEYRAQQQIVPEVKVYLGNEQIAGAIIRTTNERNNRFNPIPK